ncbi:hypothetical protein HDV57DRAFT_115513 [Trichoderma longibrachiatum]
MRNFLEFISPYSIKLGIRSWKEASAVLPIAAHCPGDPHHPQPRPAASRRRRPQNVGVRHAARARFASAVEWGVTFIMRRGITECRGLAGLPETRPKGKETLGLSDPYRTRARQSTCQARISAARDELREACPVVRPSGGHQGGAQDFHRPRITDKGERIPSQACHKFDSARIDVALHRYYAGRRRICLIHEARPQWESLWRDSGRHREAMLCMPTRCKCKPHRAMAQMRRYRPASSNASSQFANRGDSQLLPASSGEYRRCTWEAASTALL